MDIGEAGHPASHDQARTTRPAQQVGDSTSRRPRSRRYHPGQPIHDRNLSARARRSAPARHRATRHPVLECHVGKHLARVLGAAAPAQLSDEQGSQSRRERTCAHCDFGPRPRHGALATIPVAGIAASSFCAGSTTPHSRRSRRRFTASGDDHAGKVCHRPPYRRRMRADRIGRLRRRRMAARLGVARRRAGQRGATVGDRRRSRLRRSDACAVEPARCNRLAQKESRCCPPTDHTARLHRRPTAHRHHDPLRPTGPGSRSACAADLGGRRAMPGTAARDVPRRSAYRPNTVEHRPFRADRSRFPQIPSDGRHGRAGVCPDHGRRIHQHDLQRAVPAPDLLPLVAL